MIRLAISQAAFDAIARTLPFPLGVVSYENASNAKGERYVWLDPKVVEHLRALRGPGESYSEVILQLAKGDGGAVTRWPAKQKLGRSNEHVICRLGFFR